ncbi:pleckstrin homology domain-containing family M member 2 isoform X4 [Rhinopithecus roxellana]|uniref:pleckstrin homology domain-containing family M member 2 isoform X4 n=1 Tax=Rhinopithecus roxellana TaxID=61622 RepID=UPI00123790E1|nr:pleckstrin homology domain-containing family M member 2 isoform X4 [Rhinopithecus roxellana]
MEPREVKDRILENISLSVKKLQSYFAACEDETPAIRNHDKVLQRLCEHLDHALLYGLQDLSSGYWVLVVHFTRREAIKQIEVLQHVATNLGRSRAWLYLALNENSLESYLRLFQENLGLLHKYYVKNALVCSHDHLTLFLTLVSGLEFIRFELDLDAPYLDLAPYMPDYYKPQYLLDFEDRLPSSVHGSDSLSLNSFNSVTSTNLEWDDSAIAPSSEDYDFGDVFPAVPSVPSTDWEDGDLTDTVSGPRSTASDLTSSKASTRSPTQRQNPFNEEPAETVSSSDTTPVHTTSQEKEEAQALDLPDACTELEVIRVDNNHLLLLMIHVFRENEEQLFKMIRMSTGHMEGNLQLLYVLLTDCYVYLLRKGATEKPYLVEEAVSYNELDYVSVGLDQQTVKLVCTNRRKQFLLDTADVALAEFFLASLKSAMIKGCREPPYPSILTDATMEKLALAKFVAQESKCEASAVTVRFYGLVHWEDPTDESLGPAPCHCSPPEGTITKEGMLHYKAGTSYLGKEHWKTCFVVLSNGILYQYPDRTDVIPLLSVNMGGEQCGGCRRANTTDRPHAFQVILSDRPCLELSAESEAEMAEWMQHLCQAVSKGVIPQGVAPSPCIPCCLVLTDDRLFTCHEDCQTSFFRSLGTAKLGDISAVSTEPGKEYCVLEFSQDSQQILPPWVIYLSCTSELDRLLSALNSGWKTIYQVDLPHTAIQEASNKKKFEDALSLIHSAWQRSDSLCRGRASRDPWC